jgi:hypothetical protein
MSKRQGLASKLFAVLGGAGLAISVCAPRANAGAPVPPPWTNANYANRYVCNETSDENFVTGVAKINPNGAGGYSAGTLFAAGDPFFTISTSGTPPSNFCSYSLNTSSSGYAINSHGIGTEVQSWTAASTNNADCQPSFVMTTTIVIRNNLTANNTVPRTDFTSDNFMGVTNPGVTIAGGAFKAANAASATSSGDPTAVEDPGKGYCLK